MSGMLYLIASIIVADFVLATDWTYEEQRNWYPKICVEGPHQSPIALSRSVAEIAEFSPFILYGYGQSMEVILQNNGHSVKVRPKFQRQIPEIKGGGLPDVYKFDHLHFHWKSEHTMEGERFPLEMHLVHYAEKYKTFEEASNHAKEGGLAVMAVLFYFSPDEFREFDIVLDAIVKVQNQTDQEKEVDGFVIKHFMPMDVAGFYRYNGSLTTPGCTEGIIWTVFVHTLPISERQIEIFQSILTKQKKPLKENFRELQPLNDRHILLKMSPFHSGSDTIVTNKIFSCITLLQLLFYFNS